MTVPLPQFLWGLLVVEFLLRRFAGSRRGCRSLDGCACHLLVVVLLLSLVTSTGRRSWHSLHCSIGLESLGILVLGTDSRFADDWFVGVVDLREASIVASEYSIASQKRQWKMAVI